MAAVALITAESLLALTPTVIKTTAVDHISSIWSRMLTATLIGYLVSSHRGISLEEVGGSVILGYTNLLHISSSYEAFRHLPSGQAMSIMYTSPLWMLILNATFNNATITQNDYSFMSLAALGSTIINYNPGDIRPAISSPHETPVASWGILSALLAAFTEAVMQALLKHLNWRDAGKSVWVVSGGASLWLLVFLGLHGLLTGLPYPRVRGTINDFAQLSFFNGIVTFLGYYLRFYAVPRLSVVTYSILSYSGIFATYIFGLLFLGEKPSFMSILGCALIIISGFMLTRSQIERMLV
jgi:drug/metabolite transporter (DMT)-like permease